MDLGDVSTLINESVDNVVASGFNEVVMKNVGTGVSDASDIEVTVEPVNDSVTALATDVSVTLGATSSMDEVVSEINAQLGTYLTASINDDGKLALSNDTGAKISVKDISTGGEATGLGTDSATATEFDGFLKLESTDGSDVRVEKAFTSSNIGTDADLKALGFREIGTDNSSEDANQIQGKALTAAQATSALAAGDLEINGVDVYDAAIATDSIDGKLDAINAKSSETGVTASAYFEQVFDASTAVGTAAASDVISVNGVALAAIDGGDGTVSTADLVSAFNTAAPSTGITAEQAGDNIKLSGSLTSVTIKCYHLPAQL
jgi:flagellin